MTLGEYQEMAMTTCTPSSDNFAYMMLNLMGEVGEFAGKVAKAIRKEKAVVYTNNLILSRKEEMSADDIAELRKELGDIAWQLAGVCSVMGWSLDDICVENLAKLRDRQRRGVIVGDGDNR